MKNQLYFGDNLPVLREYIADESVDLIYLDPPFNSARNYNVLFKEKSGKESASQIEAFEDTWEWNQQAEAAYSELTTHSTAKVADMIEAMRSFIGPTDMMAYLVMMTQRLLELHRVLKPTGSIYLHCDTTASHYLKILMDTIFGIRNFKNEVIWKRTSAHNSAKRYGPVHDVLLFYSKSSEYVWNPQRVAFDEEYLVKNFNRISEDGRRYTTSDLTGSGTRKGESGKPWRGFDPTDKGRHWAVTAWKVQSAYPDLDLSKTTTQERLDLLDKAGLIHWSEKTGSPRLIRYADEVEGMTAQDVITDIPAIAATATERLGYPTQKPQVLLERIIESSSNEGDVVLDPFCGCGTAVAAAQKLNRRWIGIDITHLAVSLIKKRIIDHFGPDIVEDIEIIGEPTDVGSARALFDSDPFQFEWWAISLVNAMPANDKKKGADRGIDGIIRFHDDRSGKAKKVLVQVKGGKAQSSHVRDLKGTMDREKAEMGLFITLQEPTREMTKEAVTAGFYKSPLGGDYPKVQILTVKELLDGAEPHLPSRSARTTFQKAKRIKEDQVQIPMALDIE